MNWTAATGKTGNCQVGVRTFKRRDGGEGTSNEIIRFYAYDEFVNVVQPAAPTTYQQPSYQQPSYQQPSAPAASGWKPGSF